MNSRQCFIPSAIIFALLFFTPTSLIAQQHTHTYADTVLNWLKKGNDEFVRGKFNTHGVDASLRIAISKAQHPRAVILSCSDSRVPPELVFDKGLGDLFVIRVAGNILDDVVIGSIEYAVEHLHTPLVVIMGHTNCGAITAATVDLQNPNNKIDNHIRILTDKIQQAVEAVRLKEMDMHRKVLLSNIYFGISTLSQVRPVLSEEAKSGHLRITGALYDVNSGRVEWLPVLYQR